jgi:seryl-tRNA synthetase
MLDIKEIRKNPKKIEQDSKNKNFPVNIQNIIDLDNKVRPLQQEIESLQALRNQKSKKIPTLDPQERKKQIAEVQEIKKKMEDLTSVIRETKIQLKNELLKVAQPAREDVPLGKDDSFNQEVSTWGKIPEFSFTPKDHVELGNKLGMLEIEKGVKIAGSRSYALKAQGALLERAIMNFTFDHLVKQGFTPMSVPILVNEEAMEGTGYFPLGKDQAYYIEKDKLALIGTSEVSLCSLYGEEILKEQDLPLRLMAQSSCFRRESGTYGKDTKGLYRVHQFQKIEMVVFGHADLQETDKLHDELVGHAENILQALELPYRKVYVCTGDLGQGQVRKHDLETWMPSRGSYSETHSCSTFYDFQTRRLNIRYKNSEGKNTFAYTLNNTACASPRILIPFLENHQTKEGNIKIPRALQPYLQGKSELA